MVAQLTEDEIRRRIDAYNGHPTIRAAAKSLGMGASTLGHTIDMLKSTGRLAGGKVLPPSPKPFQEPVTVEPPTAIETRDANFWRNKAKAAEKQAAESEHILREMAGIFPRPLTIPDWTLPDGGDRGHLAAMEIGQMDEANSPETNALTAHEQVALATDEIAAGLKMLADQFGAVMVTVTPGNHGRTTEKTHAKRMSALSYDIMIGNILAREFAGDERITVNTASGADIVFPLFGWSILQTHGDSMGTGGGQGFAGPELPIVRGGKKIKLSGFATGERYDIILTAHYHTSSNPGSVLANGSMVGFSEYGLRIRGLPEPPQQWLALIHEKWGLRERVPVVLEDPTPPQRPRIRVPAGMVAA